ncbi:hypothetical protein STEG23_001865 [Scotinomys teguina]
MSSHNSRLAADSYKNCVWTISGEAPEFRAPVSCGVLPASLKARTRSPELRVGIPRRSSSIAAHPATRSQPLLDPWPRDKEDARFQCSMKLGGPCGSCAMFMFTQQG